MAARFSFFILFMGSNGIIFSGAGRPFVNKRFVGHPTTLTPEDFRKSKFYALPDQAVDPTKLVRKDLFEGDIAGYSQNTLRDAIMTAKSRDFGTQRSAVRDRYNLWPNGVVPYVISSNYFDIAKWKVAAALEDFHENTCIKFVPRTTETDYLYIRPDDGCYSSVGRTGGQQTVSLDEGCFQHGTIVHELMHTLGIFHEQNRNDRDSYVSIRWENIMPGMGNNFQKRDYATIDHLGTPYDYGSVMHYGDKYFSWNGQSTVVPVKSGVNIGQRTGFSFYDVRRLNLLYRCNEHLAQSGTVPSPGSGVHPTIPPPPPIPLRPNPNPGQGGHPTLGGSHRPSPPHVFGPPPPPVSPGNSGQSGSCFRKIPGGPVLLQIDRGCYRVVKYSGRITVASCNLQAETTKMTTVHPQEARGEAQRLQDLGLRQCYSEGLRRRRLGNKPEGRRPAWRFDRMQNGRRRGEPWHVYPRRRPPLRPTRRSRGK